jgi:hypothetical protein
MKKINLFNETILTSNSALTQALRANKEFGITITGEIHYAPFDPADIFIYQHQLPPSAPTALSMPESKRSHELLGPNYNVIEDGERILIKAANAWQDIIEYNLHTSHYNDISGEGVTEFSDEEIEDMGWMIIDFDVSYAELLEMLEAKADITLVCMESEEPYQSSKLGYFNNIEETRKVLFDFCQNIIKEKIANDPDYALELLDEDQREAVEFFKVI